MQLRVVRKKKRDHYETLFTSEYNLVRDIIRDSR